MGRAQDQSQLPIAGTDSDRPTGGYVCGRSIVAGFVHGIECFGQAWGTQRCTGSERFLSRRWLSLCHWNRLVDRWRSMYDNVVTGLQALLVL